MTPLRFEPLTCPRCNRRIYLQQSHGWQCPFCQTDLAIADSYRRFVALLTLASVGLLAATTHKADSGGTWILALVASAIPIGLIFLGVIPFWLKEGHSEPKLTLVSSWLVAAMTVFLIEFVGVLSAFVVLGASRREISEHLEMLSYPLAWITPNFLLTRTDSFLDLCGVILGNSVFFGLVLWACYQPVRSAFRRNRPTRLSISGTNDITEDNE